MRVTIGLPFLNAQQTLPDAIRSIFAQTFEDWELILVDDGSSDNSLYIANSVNDSRVTVISDGENLGLHERLNQIAEMANGEYLARMDSDDLMHPNRLERQIGILDRNTRLDLIGCGVYIVDAYTIPIAERDLNPIDTSPQAVMMQSILPHPTVTGKTKWFRDNPYSEQFPRAEDYELWCRTYSYSSFDKIEEPLYYLREGARDPIKYLRDYIKTARSVRRALRLHGPQAIGMAHTTRGILSLYIKEYVYRAATLSGMQSAVIKRRHWIPLDENERTAAECGLERIRQTEVPGLMIAEAKADSSLSSE